MNNVFKRPYIYFTIGIFLFYLLVNLVVSGFYNTIPLILKYATNVNWFKLLISLILSLAIGILVAINSAYIYIKYKERKKCGKEVATTSIGTIGGLITGFCPLCITGLFPIIFSLFGVSFSLASLPFQGIEIQVAVLILLSISYKMLNKTTNF